jgi:hypothetical protein
MLNSEIERALIGSSSGSDIIVHCNNWFRDGIGIRGGRCGILHMVL